MKTIGLIGGITPESTIMYYKVLNKLAENNFGPGHSSKTIIHSLDFGKVSKLQKENRWDLLDNMMIEAAISLENAGVDIVLICANTMHLSISAIKKNIEIPVIHIAEATAKKITGKELKTIALLGTKYTMEKDFFKDVLHSFNIEVLIPNEDDRNIIHEIIYSELANGVISNASKQVYLQIIDKLIEYGAEGIILGCTEIPLLVKQKDVSVPVFDTTTIHASKAFNIAINKDE